jgi:folate-dependent phosphoribosylglycinamide formyltransferase PurN
VARIVLFRAGVLRFVILTTSDLPEAYYMGAFLESAGAPFALVNITGRPLGSQMRVLSRLRRNRGLPYVIDLLLARAADRVELFVRRKEFARAPRAFPEVDARLMAGIRARHPHLDCSDPHAGHVLDFVRAQAPDYILLAGAPFLRPTFYGLARRGTLNRHLGLLPDFRGSDCAIWALALDQPDSVGYSIHEVNERVDGGDVVLRRPMPIADDPTLEDYLRRLRREASEAFSGVVGRLVDGAPLVSLPQRRQGPCYPPPGFTMQRRPQRNYARAAGRRAAPHGAFPSDHDEHVRALRG